MSESIVRRERENKRQNDDDDDDDGDDDDGKSVTKVGTRAQANMRERIKRANSKILVQCQASKQCVVR